jgi:hypothetical protein
MRALFSSGPRVPGRTRRSLLKSAAVSAALLAAPLLTPVGSASAQSLIVASGDTNIASFLNGGNLPINPDNRTLFTNILGGGNRVLIQGAGEAVNINSFYLGLAGVTSSLSGGPVSTGSLFGVDLFVSNFVSVYAAEELAALQAFSASGGSIFVLGEGNPVNSAANSGSNSLLTAIGSSMRIVPAGIGSGGELTFQINENNPLTAGVDTLTYAFGSEVTGGTFLARSNAGQTFLAVENLAITAPPAPNAVPEPSEWLAMGMAGASVCGLMLRARRRSRRATV